MRQTLRVAPPCEFDLVEFTVGVLRLTGAVGDEHRLEDVEFVIVLRDAVVWPGNVGRGENLLEPLGLLRIEVGGFDLVGLLHRLVVERHEAVGERRLPGHLGLGLGGGVERRHFKAVEAVVEIERVVGALL